MWRSYDRLTDQSDQEKSERFRRGQSDIGNLAAYYKSSRMIVGGVNLAVGLGCLVCLAAGGPASVGWVAPVGIFAGIVRLLSPSTAEREWVYYQRERQEAPTD